MSKIGVEVSTTIRSGPTNDGPVSARFQIGGVTTTGPVGKSTLVRSIADFTALYGGREAFSANTYDTARMFFEEGGSELIVSRVVGPASAKDALVLMDGEGADTLRVEAVAPGAFLTPLKAQVSTELGQTVITISQGGTPLAKLSGSTVAELVASSAKSQLVNLVDLGAVTVAPANLPVTIAATGLTGGTDDRASITVAHVIAALNTAGELGEGGAVAAPGYPASVIGTELVAYAKSSSRVALLGPALDSTADEVITEAESYVTGAGDYAGFFYPHVVIPDGSGTRTISPEGYVAAVRARAHYQVGYWRKPFGDIAQAQWIVGTVVPVNTALNNRLNDAQVNGIVTTGTKVRLYGWASLSTNPELSAVSDRDVLNNLGRELKVLLEPFVGETIDGRGHLQSQVGSEVTGLLSGIADAGGFYALTNGDEEVDPGYRVIVDTANNPLSSLAQNILNVTVLVRLSPTADWIRVEIIKVPLQGTF